MCTISIVTEANKFVATGHLMECIVCAEELIKRGYLISFWINKDAKEELKKRVPCARIEYEETIEKDYIFFLKEILRSHPKYVIFNMRKIENNFLKEVMYSLPRDIKVVCIDELGHRELMADIIINPMINSYYWNYGNSRAQLFCGAEYLILPQIVSKIHLKNKIINDEIKNVVISMGGVDPQNFTLDLLNVIPRCFFNSLINIIIGGGNLSQDKIKKKSIKYKNIKIYKNITDLPLMMYEADLMVCAGGNTLHEAACIGVPTIVIPSMPHEKMTARYFEEKGFGHVIDTDKDFYEEVSKACIMITNHQKRIIMSKKGKQISDGLGWERVIEIIENL